MWKNRGAGADIRGGRSDGRLQYVHDRIYTAYNTPFANAHIQI